MTDSEVTKYFPEGRLFDQHTVIKSGFVIYVFLSDLKKKKKIFTDFEVREYAFGGRLMDETE